MNYDLRFKLNNAQKATITKKFREFETLIRRPDEFSHVTVSAKRAKSLNGSAYAIKGKKKTKVYFYGQITKLGRKEITVKDGIYVNRIFDGVSNVDFLRQVENFDFSKLGKNEVATVTLNGRQFNLRFMQKEMMVNYLKEWSPKDAVKKGLSKKETKKLKDELFSKMHLTIVNVPRPGQVQRAKKKAAKNRSNRR